MYHLFTTAKILSLVYVEYICYRRRKKIMTKGLDGIAPAVLKDCASVLSLHLVVLDTELFNKGVFADNLKEGCLTFIFKSREKMLSLNNQSTVLYSGSIV